MTVIELSSHAKGYLALVVFFYFFILLLKRTILSPLWSIPGPFWARLTRRWIWVEEICFQSCQTVRKLHDELGPIVQIGPNEISIDDADLAHKVIYKQASHFLKNPEVYGHFQDTQESPGNVFLTTDPKVHSFLRRTMASSFSRRSILVFEAEMWKKSKEMCKRLSEITKEGKAVNISMMYRCLTMDVISSFAFGRSIGAMEKPYFEEDLLNVMDRIDLYQYMWLGINWIRRLLMPILEHLPVPLFQAMKVCQKQVSESLQDAEGSSNSSLLFTMMKTSTKGLDRDLTQEDLQAAGFASLLAGTDTAGLTLAVGSWEIFKDKKIQTQLYVELRSVWPDTASPPNLSTLESLPYLRACVKESLRLATAVAGRLTRIVPREGLTYQGHRIPAGTVISSSAYLMHTNKDVFPESDRFDPGRWLVEDPDLLKTRERHLFAFSEGSRKCLGINLALAELYVSLAMVFRQFQSAELITKKPKINRIFTSTIAGGLHVCLEKCEDEV